MIPDAVLVWALFIGAFAIAAYFGWTDARKNEGSRYKGENGDD